MIDPPVATSRSRLQILRNDQLEPAVTSQLPSQPRGGIPVRHSPSTNHKAFWPSPRDVALGSKTQANEEGFFFLAVSKCISTLHSDERNFPPLEISCMMKHFIYIKTNPQCHNSNRNLTYLAHDNITPTSAAQDAPHPNAKLHLISGCCYSPNRLPRKPHYLRKPAAQQLVAPLTQYKTVM